MYLKNIALVNIGPYTGYNQFNFETSQNKNVLLIGGENGAGKTTLLNAIKLGLFGSYGFGYKTETDEYLKHVKSILNNNAKREQSNDFSITIQFSIIDNLEKLEYELKREWRLVHNNLKEQVFLTENNVLLDDNKIELFNSKLKNIMPPQLLEFCLFDGEEIAKIITQNRLSTYIKQLSKVVFNLDLFETLELDLENYSKQQTQIVQMDSIEKELLEANSREKNLRSQIATSIRDVERISNKLRSTTEEYLEIKTTFEKYGGLVKKEREEILTQMAQLEADRKHRAEQIKQFVSTLLPFFIMSQLVIKTREQIKNEDSLHLYQQLNEKLSDELMFELLSELKITNKMVQAEQLKNSLISIMQPETTDEIIHGASFSESVKIEQVYNIIQKGLPNEYLELLLQNQDDLKLLQQLRSKISIHDTTNEFGELIHQMNEYNSQILKLQQQLEVEEKILVSLKEELATLLEKNNKIKLQLHSFNKTSGSLLEAQKIIALSRRYRDIQVHQKLKDVQIQATRNLKKMLRKHDYISLVQINPENYDVILLDMYGNELEKRTLSAGEKQILLISIIWAIFKCSGRQVPFIFDTLLGRLDKTHKTAILNTFIPNFGKQAIILSTDSEIDQEHYNILSPYIAREYKLDFDAIKQQTKIKKDYFNFN